MMDESVLKTITMLYAEDDDYIRTVVAKFLKRRIAKLYEIANGKEGLDLYISHKEEIDLVLTDIQLPGMTGMRMIDEILKIDKTQKIIITTAYEDEYHMSDKVCSNIIKPIDFDKLIVIIMSCLGIKV